MLRLASLQLLGPAGQQVTIQANSEGELLIEMHHKDGFTVIRDTGLPPHQEGDGAKVPRVHRIVAQLPTTWAILPEWELTAPLPPTRLRSVDVPEPIRHSGMGMPSEGCNCAECVKYRAKEAIARNPESINGADHTRQP